MKLLFGLIILVVYHQVGNVLMYWTGWPIPGSVVGLILLLFSLHLFKDAPESIQISSEFLLKHLAFLFVPAGVGIMLLFDLIADEWLAMLLSMVLSTLISLVFTAWLMQLLLILRVNTDE